MASSGQFSIPVITAIHFPVISTTHKYQMLLPDQCTPVSHPHSMPVDVKLKQENSVTTAANNVSKIKPALPAKPESIGEMLCKRQPNMPSPSRGHNRSPSDGVQFRSTRNKFEIECNHSKSELDLKCAGKETCPSKPLSIAERTKLFEDSNVDNIVKITSPLPPSRPRSQNYDNPPAVQENRRSSVHLSSISKPEIPAAPCPVTRQTHSIAQMAKLFEHSVTVESKNDKLKIESPDRTKEKTTISHSKILSNGSAPISDLVDCATVLNESVDKLDNAKKIVSLDESVNKLDNAKKIVSLDVEGQKNENNSNSKLEIPKGPPPPKPPRTYAHDIYLWVKAKSQNKKPLTVVPETPENTAALYQTLIPKSQRPPKKTLNEVDEDEKNRLQEMLEEFYTYSKENVKSTANKPLNKVDLNVLSNPITKPPRKSPPASSQGKPKLPPRPPSPSKQIPHAKPTPPRPPPPKPNYKSPYLLNRKPLNDSISLSNQKIPWPFDCISGSSNEKHIYDSVPEANSRFFISLNSPVSPNREYSSLKRSFSEEHIYAEPDIKRINSAEEKTYNSPQEEEAELKTKATPYMSSPVRVRPRSRSLHDTSRSSSTSPPRDRHGPETPRPVPTRVIRHRGLTNVMDKVNQAFAMMKKRLSSDSSVLDPEIKDKELEDQEGDSDVEVSQKDVQERITYMRFIKENHYSNVELENELYRRAYPRLFEFVVLVGLKINDDVKKYEPYIKMRFPPEVTSLHDRTAIPQFCFPDASTWQPVTIYHSETYYFVLTNEIGIKTFGYCRRVLSAGSGPRLPLVYCVISPIRAVNFYTKLLNELVKRHHMSDGTVTSFLQSAYSHNLPTYGKALSIKTVMANGNSIVTLARLPDLKAEHLGVGCLLKLLDVNNLLKIFGSLLLERRVIFASPSLSSLSQCIHALTSLLYPFSWQHTFIPVLPDTLLDICQSPIPYIIGIKSSSLAQITEQVLIVDLERSQLKQEFGDEGTILPNRIRKPLNTALSMSKDIPEAMKEEMIAEAFVRGFVEMVGHYGDHIVTHQDGSKHFQKENFCHSVRSKNLSLFLQWFTETQMFQVFIEEKLTEAPQRGLFEDRILQYQENSSFNLRGNVKEIGRKVKSFGERLKKAF